MLEKILIGLLIGLLIWIFTKVVPGFLKKGWESFKNRQQNLENASHDYNTPYKKRHGQLQAFCVGMEAQSSVDDVYVVVQFLAKRQATKHNSTEDVGKVFLQKGRGYFTATSDERQGGMRVATNEQYLMVLGPPVLENRPFSARLDLRH